MRCAEFPREFNLIPNPQQFVGSNLIFQFYIQVAQVLAEFLITNLSD